MLAQLSAFEVLALVLVMGSLGALAGWAGGAGARLSFSARLDRVEGLLMQVLNRAKGANGQAVAAVQRARASSAEREAEELAAKLAASGRRSPRPRGPLSEQEAEEAQLAHLERVARQRGLALTAPQASEEQTG